MTETLNIGGLRLVQTTVELNVKYETVDREGRKFALIEVFLLHNYFSLYSSISF